MITTNILGTMKAERIIVNEKNPEPRKLRRIAEVLRGGGVIVYPTDTVYALGCDLFNFKAMAQLRLIKGKGMRDSDFSLIFSDLSHLSPFVGQLDNQVFKILKRTLPGPYTYVLKASSKVPKIFKAKKSTVGIRIPDNRVSRGIVDMLANPIMTTSLRGEDDIEEYVSDPQEIFERYNKVVDLVVDSGYGDNQASTVVDFTTLPPTVLRQGKGDAYLP